MSKTLITLACLFAGPVLASPPARQQPPTQEPQTSAAVPEPLSYGLARKGAATVEDAYRLFVGLAADQGRITPQSSAKEMSFDELTLQLESLRVIDPSWKYGPTTCLRRDVLAYLCASYMGCRPGLLTGLCGMTRRYAHREMLHQGVMGPGTPNMIVSGSELLAIVGVVSERTNPKPEVTLTEDAIQ